MRDFGAEMNAAATLASVVPPPVLISARGLSYDIGGVRLIDTIDLDIRAGRITAVLGANGAGKSLLLRLLHGLLAPACGEVLWQGRALDRAARRAQAMVFQRPVMLRRSVRANLRFALSVRGLTGHARAAREAEALARANLTDFADRPARKLSGGEQQRLAVARALAGAPDILFLDEPTANLDPASTQAIEDLVWEARSQGVSVVIVTHDAGQARRLAEDAVFLHAGRVVESGPAHQLIEAPISAPARAWRDGRLYVDPPKHHL